MSQTQYDSTLSIAKRLYEEDCLEKPSIEAVVLRTLQIMTEEYNSNSQSLVLYYKERKSEEEKLK
ncbi:MAG: hypothetical protein WCF23_00360 [Candidatus Nitrosopolaris sp.]